MEVFARRSLYTEVFLHTDTQRGFYTQKRLHLHSKLLHTQGLLHREAFRQRSFLHTEGFTQRSLYPKGLLHTNGLELLHTEAVTQRSLYTESFNTQTRLHTETFKHRSVYTESFTSNTRKLLHKKKSLHKRAFTQRSFHTQKEAFTQRSLDTELFLHSETFTHKSFYTQSLCTSLHRGALTRSNKLQVEIGSSSLGKTLRRSFRELSWTHLLPEKPSIANKYVPNNLRNIFLKQVLIQ